MQQRVGQDSEGNVPKHSEHDVGTVEDISVVLGDDGIRKVQGDYGVLRDVFANDGNRCRSIPRVHGHSRVRVLTAGRACQRSAIVDAVDARRRQSRVDAGGRLLRVHLHPKRDHVLFGDAVRAAVFHVVLQAEDGQRRRC